MATVEKMPMLAVGYDMMTAQLRELKAERPLIIDAIEAGDADAAETAMVKHLQRSSGLYGLKG